MTFPAALGGGLVPDGGRALLSPFVEAGVLDAADVHVAGLIARTLVGLEPEVLLGAALAARAVRLGHVCIVVVTVAGSVVVDEAAPGAAEELAWPDAARWGDLLAASPAVRLPEDAQGEVILPLVWDGTRLYLERYWRFEERVAADLLRRAGDTSGPGAPPDVLEAVLHGLFDSDAGTGREEPEARQREAVTTALASRIAVIAGGPGTGKTLTVSRLLAAAYTLALERGRRLSVALAAPTGKAATRMTEAVHAAAVTAPVPEISEAMGATEAKTVHRLLGIGSAGAPRYDQANRLPHDLVVVDELSMVSLPIMGRLLDAVRPDATVVLVGDPFQLASVEAGAVLGEIVGPRAQDAPATGPLADKVVVLKHNYRFGQGSKLAAFAEAVRKGDADGAMALLRDADAGELRFVELGGDDDDEALAREHEEAAANALRVIRAAQRGDAAGGLEAASELKVLCATRHGPLGVSGWTSAIEVSVKELLPDVGVGGRRYLGRPVIVTRNDYLNNLFNGDVGLVVVGERGPVVAFHDAVGGVRTLSMSQLGAIDTWWATTIHKSQGSEFERVIVSLPPAPSPILTRELLYTAVTRASSQVTVAASETSVRAAITRPVARASGLRAKLWPADPAPDATGRGRPDPAEVRQLSFDI